jgi:hypothetical protein
MLIIQPAYKLFKERLRISIKTNKLFMKIEFVENKNTLKSSILLCIKKPQEQCPCGFVFSVCF